MNFLLWPVTSDFKRIISMVYYSLIKGFGVAVISIRYHKMGKLKGAFRHGVNWFFGWLADR